jgi:5-methylcytosine-specific restriction protein A
MPPASLRPCPSCGAPQLGGCARCGWQSKATRIYTPKWRRTSREILAAWRATHGDWCPGWPDTGHDAHATSDLTVHHTTEDPDGPLSVLCRPVNSALGAPQRPGTRG